MLGIKPYLRTKLVGPVLICFVYYLKVLKHVVLCDSSSKQGTVGGVVGSFLGQ